MNPNDTAVDDATRELILGFYVDCPDLSVEQLQVVICADSGRFIPVDVVRAVVNNRHHPA